MGLAENKAHIFGTSTTPHYYYASISYTVKHRPTHYWHSTPPNWSLSNCYCIGADYQFCVNLDFTNPSEKHIMFKSGCIPTTIHSVEWSLPCLVVTTVPKVKCDLRVDVSAPTRIAHVHNRCIRQLHLNHNLQSKVQLQSHLQIWVLFHSCRRLWTRMIIKGKVTCARCNNIFLQKPR